MKPFAVELVSWIHPRFGETRIWWQWHQLSSVRNEWVWLPVALEFDLFCPPDEQQALLDELTDRCLEHLHREVDRVGGAAPTSPEALPELTKQLLSTGTHVPVHDKIYSSAHLVVAGTGGRRRKARPVPPDGAAS